MNDGRGASWSGAWDDDDAEQRRHHHPAVDRGHSVLRTQHDGQPAGYDGASYASPDGGYPPQGGYPASGGYYDQGQGYDGQGYDGQGYDHQGQGYDQGPDGAYYDQAPQYPDQNYPGQGYGPGYPEPGYYDQQSQPRYDPNGYYPPTGGNGSYAGQQYPDQQYGDQQYPDQQYGGQQYPDQQYPDQQYGGQSYQPDPYGQPYQPESSYPDDRYGRPGYPDEGYDAGYPSGGTYQPSFIERGFDFDGQQPPTDGRGRRDFTDGRGRRDTDGSGRQRTTGGQQAVGFGEPYADDSLEGAEKPRKRRTGLVFLLAIAMLALVGLGGYYGYGKIRDRFSAPDYSGTGEAATVNITVNNNDNATDVAQTLYKADVVKSAKAFVNAATSDPTAARSIQPGLYKMHKHMSAKSALAALVAKDANGKLVNKVALSVTIPEGMISVQIFALLHEKTGVPLKDLQDAAKDPEALGVPSWWFDGGEGKKSAAKIEGFLFPDTYSFDPGTDATTMLKAMVSEFNDTIDSLGFRDKVKALNIPPYEALITASIAQKEAVTSKDMGGVSRVIYNRAYKNFAGNHLGLDSTINYWLALHGKDTKQSKDIGKAQQDATDPYNTYLVKGMPPGAISNPGKDALSGAMAPPKTSYYYFVTIDTKGDMAYATTLAGHNANIAKACKNGVTDLSC